MLKFNLLPQEIKPTGKSAKIIGLVAKINVLGFATLILFAIAVLVFLRLNAINLEKSQARQEDLMATIRALEQTEQKLVFLKDRIAKVKALWLAEDTTPQVEKVAEVVSRGGGTFQLTSLEGVSGKSETTFLTPDSIALTGLMQILKTANIYKNVILNSLSYSTKTLYLVDLKTSDK